MTPLTIPEAKEVSGVKLLGAGGFGEAYSVQTTEGKRVVVKLVKDYQHMLDHGYSPIEIYLSCSYTHLNFMHGLGVRHASDIHPSFKGRGLAVVLRQYDSDLAHYMSDNPREYLARRPQILIDIIHGYRGLRDLGLIHGDMKPLNVLVRLKPFRCVISDFGLCRPIPKATDSRIGMGVGTPGYLPPEAYNSFKQGQLLEVINYSEAFDMYALGVMIEQIANIQASGLPEPFVPLLQEAVTGLKAKEVNRWTLNRLLESDFYTYLRKESPKRSYIPPKQRVHVNLSKLSQSQASYIIKCYEFFREDIDALSVRTQQVNAMSTGGILMRQISMETLSRAQAVLWTLAPRLAEVKADQRILCQTLLWIGYKMTHAGELPVEYIRGKVNKEAILQTEEHILTLTNGRQTLNSLFDVAANEKQVLEAVTLSNTKTLPAFSTLFELDIVSKFSLSLDDRSVPLSGLIKAAQPMAMS